MTAKTTATTGLVRRRRRYLPATLIATALSAIGLCGPASALAAPVLDLSSTHIPATSPVPASTSSIYTVGLSNIGDSPTSGPATVDFTVPVGLKVSAVTDEVDEQVEVPVWGCSIAGDSRSVSCTGPEFEGSAFVTGPGEEACEAEVGFACRLVITVTADSNAPSGILHPTITACGGGATTCPTVATTAPDDPLEIVPLGFRLTNFDGGVLKPNGDPATQAGSHPQTASTTFSLLTGIQANGIEKGGQYTIGQLKDASVELPPGLIGNPRAVPTCTQAQLSTEGTATNCPPESQVGVVNLDLTAVGFDGGYLVGVYNMEVPYGLPALFGFNVLGNVTQVYGKLRTGTDYGVTVLTKNAPQTLPIGGVDFTFWGVPGDHSHEADRYCAGVVNRGCPSAEEADPKPFVSLPTSCVGAVRTDLQVTSWEGGSSSASFLSHDNTEPDPNPIGADGCNAVDFSPTLEARPTTTVADAPSGLDVDLHIPQNEDPNGTAEAHLKDTTVVLPKGLTVNPSGANGLSGCSPAEFGLTSPIGAMPIQTTPSPAQCPDASKLGTVEIDTPLLANPLHGSVYIAAPHNNPFNSLLAIYIAVDDPQTSVVVKLAGEVHADPVTGQLTTTVEESPQLPFEDFKLHFSGGSSGSLRTPALCGQYTTTSSLTPWTAPDSGPPATPFDAYGISQAPGGGSCATSDAARPNTPDIDAGTVSPIAGSYSPFVVNLRRGDGSQEFSSVTLTPPPGLIGKLAGIPACSDSALAAAAAKTGAQESASPSCPAASEVGTVTAGAGAGPAPYYASGKVYLAGPYKGAPLSLVTITPATAGPFDLGTIAVRVALRVDPNSAQITAVSDPIPSILQGIPLDLRSVLIKLDRSNFTLNPTSCNPFAFSGQLLSTVGQAAPLAEPFQVGECGRLGFRPKLDIRLSGGTHRGAHPALRAVLQMPAGGANIAKASVALPHSEFLDQSHIGTVCTRVQFAADQCPAASIYGHAVGTSPLVDYAVEGSVYLRSSSNKLPDLVLALHGPPSQPVEVDAAARIDTVKGGIRSTFEGVPDVPLTKVVLSMAGGKKGLLQNSTNICAGKHLATAEFDGQNGKAADLKPSLKVKCAKKHSKRKSHHRRAAAR